MNEMVERIAGTIALAEYEDGAAFAWPHDFSTAEVTNARRQARAVLTVMREPTEAMLEAGKRAALAKGAHDCEVPMSDVYQAMIDAARTG